MLPWTPVVRCIAGLPERYSGACTPGATFDRELLALQIMQCVWSVSKVTTATDFSSVLESPVVAISVNGFPEKVHEFEETVDCGLTALSPFLRSSLTHSLLNSFVSAGTRVAA